MDVTIGIREEWMREMVVSVEETVRRKSEGTCWRVWVDVGGRVEWRRRRRGRAGQGDIVRSTLGVHLRLEQPAAGTKASRGP